MSYLLYTIYFLIYLILLKEKLFTWKLDYKVLLFVNPRNVCQRLARPYTSVPISMCFLLRVILSYNFSYFPRFTLSVLSLTFPRKNHPTKDRQPVGCQERHHSILLSKTVHRDIHLKAYRTFNLISTLICVIHIFYYVIDITNKII